jgi:tRNA-specific adenosine deaminase 3
MSAVDGSAPELPYARIAESPGRGRGVFATREIPSRTLIDESPIILISDDEYARVATTLLKEYTFKWRGGMALAIGGLGSLFNHRRSPNVGWLRDFDARTLRFIALRDIAAKEELFICYGPALWFRDADGDNGEGSSDEECSASALPNPPTPDE